MSQRGRFNLLIILLMAGALPSPVMAQMLHFRKFTTSDGLIQGTILALKQDSIGRIWIGTSEGVSVYDGQNFENLSSRNGLKDEIVECFFEPRSGKMLMGTDGAGITLSVHPPGRPDTLIGTLMGKRFLCQDSVNKIIRDSNGNMWFCTDGGATSWTFGKNNSITVHRYGKKQGLSSRPVTDVVKGPGGALWFSTVDGVFKEDKEHFVPITEQNRSLHIMATSLCFDNNGTLWIGTQRQGIMSYSNDHISRYSWGSAGKLGRINVILKDRDGTLWFGTDRGLVHYDHKNVKLIDEHSGLTNNHILSLMQDREGNIWIGTESGLNLYLADGFASIFPGPGNIEQISKDPEGDLITVGLHEVLKVKDFQLRPFQLVKKMGIQHVYRIFFVSKDSIWVITGKGLFFYDVVKKRLREIKGNDGLPVRFVFSLVTDHNGILWIGSDNGLSLLTKHNIYKAPSSHQLSEAPVRIRNFFKYTLPQKPLRCMIVDHRNRVWLGYWDAGLYMFDGEHVKYFGNKEGLTSHMIRRLFEDRNGDIWIATRDKGVFRYDGKTFQNFSKANVLESNWVRSIAQDSSGRMWFGTAHGLSVYDGSKWKSYHSLPGLLIDDVNCILPVSSNTVWFGTSSSLFCYNYKNETASNKPPTIYIKSVTQNNHQIGRLSFTTDLTQFSEIFRFLSTSDKRLDIAPLSYNHNELSIEIAGIHYQNNSDIRYTYKLVGLDSTWTIPGSRSFVNYRNLPPGTYRFLAKTGVDGVWNPVPASLSFTILTPYWQQVWFLGLIIGLGILLVVVITSVVNRYRYRQLLKIAQIRSDIASDLHDDIGSALSSISIYSELAKRETRDNPDRAAHFTGRVEEIARNLMDTMNDIIWSINPGNEGLEDAILRMEEFAVEMLEAKGMEVYLKTPGNSHVMPLDLHVRRNLLMIFKEIVNNTAKHSGAQRVDIKIEVTESNPAQKKSVRMLNITVNDNGEGFDVSLETDGNGLHNIKKRIKDIGGTIHLTSAVGKGTKTEVSVPLHM